MSNSKKLPDLSEKSVESINSGDSRLAANLNINCSEVRRLMNNSSDLIIKYFSSDGHRMAVITCEGMIGKAELANLIFRLYLHRRKYRTITNFLQRSAQICRLPKNKSRCTIMTRCAFI